MFYKFRLPGVAVTKKAINILTKKIHEDYRVDYAEELNHYLMKLKARANYFDFVSILPNKI